MRRPRPRDAGFSLIEVLCAVIVLAIGLVGIMEAITMTLGSSRSEERHTIAAMLASGRIEELLTDQFLTAGEDEGGFGDDFPAYQWTQSVEESSYEGLLAVTVTVQHAETEEPLFDLQTEIFRAPASDLSAGDEESSGRGRGGRP